MATEDPIYQQPIANAFSRPESAQQLGKVVKADRAYRVWLETGEWGDRKKFIAKFYQAVQDDF